MSVTLLRMRSACAGLLLLLLLVYACGSPWFSWYTAKVVAMVLREASALMRTSSIICNQWRSTVTLCIHIVIFL